jgi:hypothetical protein
MSADPLKLFRLLLALSIFSYSVVMTKAENAEEPRRHEFTIRDSIELSNIVTSEYDSVIELRDSLPLGTPLASPDGRYFVLQTERGRLATNKLESTIWLFDMKAVLNYAHDQSLPQPAPVAIATLAATSNLPVIADIRWAPDSQHITLLGKDGSPYQRLFSLDINTHVLTPMTGDAVYVSAYDIKGGTIAYTTLQMPTPMEEEPVNSLISVKGKSLLELLDHPSPGLQDLTEDHLLTFRHLLHIQRDGQDSVVPLVLRGRPFTLFHPVLALSPDAKSLITSAPIDSIPPNWHHYHPGYQGSLYVLTPNNKYALSDDNPFRVCTYVVVNLSTGESKELTGGAPLAQNVGYGGMTVAVWSKDNKRALLTNTFLAPEKKNIDKGDDQRYKSAAVIVVDTVSGDIQTVTFDVKSGVGSEAPKGHPQLKGVTWDEGRSEVCLTFGLNTTSVDQPSAQIALYALHGDHWTPQQVSSGNCPATRPSISNLIVRQDLNQPSILEFDAVDGQPVLIWDPNPDVSASHSGVVTDYHWKDARGYDWSGILALPNADVYQAPYPLVIQTHGFSPKNYFADGEFTTGSGGRALVAKGIAVLQMDMPSRTDSDTPGDGPASLAGFESAISALTAAKKIDPQRVGVIGFSFTCSHVLYALANQPKLFAAASITDGINMGYFQYLVATDYEGNSAQEAIASGNGGRPFGEAGLLKWSRNSPEFNLDRVQTPLLVSALERGELLADWGTYAGLRILNKPVDMLWLKHSDPPHILVQPKHRYASQQTALDWFLFWLLDDEREPETTPGQHERWRALRQLQ